MKLSDFAKKCGNVDLDMRIKVEDTRLCGTSTIDIKSVSTGLDWDHGKLIITPEKPLCIVDQTNILNVYILSRQDDWKYDEPIEQTIVAKTKEKAIELANKYPGIWDIEQEIDLTTERVLTIDKNEG